MKIGFVMPMGEDPEVGWPPAYREIRQLALRVERAGFDSVWVYDHLLYRFPDRPPFGIWECWSILTALAEATERVDLGTIVLAAPWRNPALLAKMAITVDEISAGRLILGLGAGWHEPEFNAFGYPFDHRVARFEEALQVIRPLLREGKVDFHGKYVSAPDCEMRPPSTRPGGLPILVASRGPRMLRLTAEHADLWNNAWFGRVDAIAPSRAALEAACAEVGRDPATLGVTVGVNVSYPPPGETSDPDTDPNRVLFGTPEEVAAALRAFDDAGVTHLICAGMARATYDYAGFVLDQLTEALALYRDGE